MTEIQKKKMVKLIHTQKTRTGIDDEAYCCILMGAANVQSSLDLQTITQFSAVITALNKLLASQGQAPLGGSARPVPRGIYPLKKEPDGYSARMRTGGSAGLSVRSAKKQSTGFRRWKSENATLS